MDFVLVERLGDFFDVVVIDGECGDRQVTLGNLVVTISVPFDEENDWRLLCGRAQ